MSKYNIFKMFAHNYTEKTNTEQAPFCLPDVLMHGFLERLRFILKEKLPPQTCQKFCAAAHSCSCVLKCETSVQYGTR